MSGFADRFSEHASDYARVRPTYPAALLAWLAAEALARDVAWDCGTGSGQAAVEHDLEWETLTTDGPGERALVNSGYRTAVIPAPFVEFAARWPANEQREVRWDLALRVMRRA